VAKLRRSQKESKKQPLQTAKEKKAAKHEKKHANDTIQLVTKKP